MDFKQLRSFVAVADCGSFTQAAAKLYASQPTVSAHIRQLEDELHETLFLRTTKSLAITPRGRELYDYAVHVLDLQEQLMRAWAQDERTIRLGASTIPSSCILPEVLPAFRAQHPEAVFSILQSDSAGVLQQLRAGRFALGFTGAKEEAQDVVFSPFFTDRMVLITPNTPRYQRLLKEKMPVPALLAQEPLLLRETGSGSQKCADAFLEEAGLDLSTLRVDSTTSRASEIWSPPGSAFRSSPERPRRTTANAGGFSRSRSRKKARDGACISSGANPARSIPRRLPSSNLSGTSTKTPE